MNQLKQVLLDALGIIDLNDIKKLVELCWKCYNTPVTQQGIIPQDTILVDKGTKQLVSEIDIMMKKLGKEINFKKYRELIVLSIYVFLIIIVFVGSERYHIPLLPIHIFLAAKYFEAR